MPLDQDLPLKTAGVMICARVDWKNDEVRNRIVFKSGTKEAIVECIHTIVYAGPADNALTFAMDGCLREKQRAWMQRAGGPVTLPPWEHFAALKSYVGAIADMGIFTMFRVSGDPAQRPSLLIPFGFNPAMQEQVTRALEQVAPDAMDAYQLDLAAEYLDSQPPGWIISNWKEVENTPNRLLDLFRKDPNQFLSRLLVWGNTVTYLSLPWELPHAWASLCLQVWPVMLKTWDAETITRWFRLSSLWDRVQDRLFEQPALLADAKAIAPDLPWDMLRLEWQARRLAEQRNFDGEDFPPVEIWAREPFCGYTFPRDILAPDTPVLRRSRVQAFLSKPIFYLDDVMEDDVSAWAQNTLSHIDDALAAPFPADRSRPKPQHRWDPTQRHYVDFTPAEVVHSIEQGDHKTRRNVVLCYPVPPEWQEKLAAHWDFATRLALVGNPATIPAVIATLARDPQPCVRLAAEARMRKGTATFEPLFGEILDPGEIVWLLTSHPNVNFLFGVTAWGDGSDAYRDWYNTRRKEIWKGEKNPWEDRVEDVYSWAFNRGIMWQMAERNPPRSYLAYHGLSPFACYRWPCMFLGLNFFTEEWDEEPPS